MNQHHYPVVIESYSNKLMFCGVMEVFFFCLFFDKKYAISVFRCHQKITGATCTVLAMKNEIASFGWKPVQVGSLNCFKYDCHAVDQIIYFAISIFMGTTWYRPI